MNDALEEILAGRAPDLSALDIDTRDVEVRRMLAEREAFDRAESRRLFAADLRDAGEFPARYVNAATAGPSDTPAMIGARKYLASRKSVLVLAGGVGAGKTTAAAWIAIEAGSAHVTLPDARGSLPAFIRAAELEARGRYDKHLRTWLRERSMLVLDDLGAEFLDGKNAFSSLLDEVIELYYSNHRRIVITTNLRARRVGDSEPQFIERYGERVASRLHEVGLWHECGARDLRRTLSLVEGGT
ncbi:MAG: ATP-binding protein [Kofleriaceae bacterium]